MAVDESWGHPGAAEVVNLFLLAGQSNLAGRAPAEALRAFLRAGRSVSKAIHLSQLGYSRCDWLYSTHAPAPRRR